MRLVQTSARGENSMDVESFSLLESGSTMPHRGIALPPLTWYLCIDWGHAAAFSIYQRQTNHHSSLVQPQPLLFLSVNLSFPRVLIEPDDPSGLLFCLILLSHFSPRAHHATSSPNPQALPR